MRNALTLACVFVGLTVALPSSAGERGGGRQTGANLADGSVPASPKTPRQRAVHVIRHVWPAGQWANAIRVVRCETGGTFRARTINWRDRHYVNGRLYRGSWGLFQIGALHTWAYKRSPYELLNPWVNARAALRLWKANGWSPWTCRP